MTSLMESTASGQALDVAGALKRLAGNQKLYEKLLTKFLASYASTADDIQNLLDTGTLDEAERAAHTIKGLAGNLGASGLQAAAAALEPLCRPGADTTARSAALAAFRQQLAEALAGVKAYLDGLGAPEQPAASRPGGVPSETMRLFVTLMQEDDAKACSVYLDLKPAIAAAYPAIAAPLEKAVDNFDFKEALDLVNKVFPG